MGQEELGLTGPLSDSLDRLGQEFLAGILAVEVARRPDNLEARADLGHALTRLGRHAEALAVDRELVRRTPECETARYNLACSLAQCGEVEAALGELERAAELGFSDADLLEEDVDLAALRETERFRALVLRLRGTPGC